MLFLFLIKNGELVFYPIIWWCLFFIVNNESLGFKTFDFCCLFYALFGCQELKENRWKMSPVIFVVFLIKIEAL